MTDNAPHTSRRARAAAEAKERVSLWRMLRAGFSWALLIAVAALALVVVVVPAVAGAHPYTVLTGSMVPLYPPGTLVVVRAVDPADIAIGDVVTYQLHSGEPQVVTHRVVGIQLAADGEITFITQGDANNIADEKPVREAQVVGRLWYAVPYIGWINNVITGSFRAWAIPLAAGGLVVYGAVLFIAGARDRARTRRVSREARAEVDAEADADADDEPSADQTLEAAQQD